MSQKSSKPKIGQGALKAAFRQGIKELGRALQALPTSLPMVDEPGQMWSPTPQAVSQQTGVSQKVNFSDRQSPKGFDAMNAPETNEPETATPEVSPNESILDGLVENAEAMSHEPEMEKEVEMDP